MMTTIVDKNSRICKEIALWVQLAISIASANT